MEGPVFSSRVAIGLRVNGTGHALDFDARTSLLDLLREHLGLTGAKKGCNRGECGACTVLLDGARVNACMVLAASADGRDVTTVEGLAAGGRLHPVQQAFIDQDAFQCGFCTAGQIMSAVGCVREGHATSGEEIREWMSGNICRCSARRSPQRWRRPRRKGRSEVRGFSYARARSVDGRGGGRPGRRHGAHSRRH